MNRATKVLRHLKRLVPSPVMVAVVTTTAVTTSAQARNSWDADKPTSQYSLTGPAGTVVDTTTGLAGKSNLALGVSPTITATSHGGNANSGNPIRYGSSTPSICTVVRGTLDIDGDSKYNPKTDGLLVARYIIGLTGSALTRGAVAIGGGATRTSNVDILAFLNGVRATLDVNASGNVDDKDAVLILRWMFGFRGTALVAPVRLPAGTTTTAFADAVQSRLAPLTP